jgi:hypothetical protein
MGMTDSAQTQHPESGTILGFPLKGFGFFLSLLLAFASAFFAFFASTTVAIFALLAWRLAGHDHVDFTASYRWVGFPAFVIVLVIALPLFGTLWVRAKLRQ